MKIRQKSLFRDSNQNTFFEEMGYTTLPVLEPEEVQELLSYYKEIKDQLTFSHGVHISYEHEGFEMRKKIGDFLMDYFQERLQKRMANYQIFMACYILKSGNSKINTIPIHQDWNFFNEQAGYSSGTLWVSLVDTFVENGGICVLPGTHKIMNNIRYTPGQYADEPFGPHSDYLMPYMQNVDLKAGNGLMWHHRVLHGSMPNTSDHPRINIGLGIGPKEATLRHYSLFPNSEKRQVAVYEIDKDFLMKHNPPYILERFEKGLLLEKEPMEIIDIVAPEISAADLAHQVENVFKLKQNETMIDYMEKLVEELPEVDAPTTNEIPVQENPIEIVENKNTEIPEKAVGFWQKIKTFFAGIFGTGND